MSYNLWIKKAPRGVPTPRDTSMYRMPAMPNKYNLKRSSRLLPNGTIEIPLTKGQFTVIDAKHSDLAQSLWMALSLPNYANGGSFVAGRNITHSHGRRTMQLLHVVILSRMTGRELTAGEEVDHRDTNPLNNLESNLRLATRSQNNMNKNKYRNNSSGFKGVYIDKGRWRAEICVNKQRIRLGSYATAEEAYRAYCKAAKELHGEFFKSDLDIEISEVE